MSSFPYYTFYIKMVKASIIIYDLYPYINKLILRTITKKRSNFIISFNSPFIWHEHNDMFCKTNLQFEKPHVLKIIFLFELHCKIKKPRNYTTYTKVSLPLSLYVFERRHQFFLDSMEH